MDPIALPRIPNRHLALKVLDRLMAGYPIVVLGDFSFSTVLDGAPDVCLIFSFLKEVGWIKPIAPRPDLPGALRYGITSAGRESFEAGLSWWRSLGFIERMRVRLFG